MRFPVLLLTSLLASACASSPSTESEPVAQAEGETTVEAAAAVAEETETRTSRQRLEEVSEREAQKADDLRDATTRAIQASVSRLDAFFVNEDYATFEENDTRVRLRLDTDHIENHGWEVRPRLKVNWMLPRSEERLRLVVNDGDALDEERTPSDNQNEVAVRWIARQSKARSFNFDVGLRFRSWTPDVFVRANTGWQYPLGEKWHLQSTNRLYYYGQTGVRNDFRQFLNRPINDNFLFRSRTRIQYFEENDWNPNLEQKFSLFQTLASDIAIAYEAIWRKEAAEDSLYDDDEIVIPAQDNYENVVLRMRFRSSVWRPWLFFEFWPAIGWAEERDWETVLGFRMRLEINYGWHGDLRLDE